MTREEHLEWSKQRALEYLPSSPAKAMASILSDLNKHPDLASHPGLMLMPPFFGDHQESATGRRRFVLRDAHNDPEDVRKWILGFQ